MTRFLFIILPSLLLLGTATCTSKKTEPEPKPQLEGSWTGETITATHYDQAEQLLFTVGSKPASYPFKIIISTDSITTYATNLATPTWMDAVPYRRQEDVLVHSGSQSIQIKELTAHTLVLFQKGRPNFGGSISSYRVDIETRYSR